jgi:hypothetical protein
MGIYGLRQYTQYGVFYQAISKPIFNLSFYNENINMLYSNKRAKWFSR